LFVTIHHDRGGRSATPGTTTCASTCANDLKVSNYRCRISEEEFGRIFLGSMAYLDPKGEGDRSMP
jgi:hypothetical protein